MPFPLSGSNVSALIVADTITNLVDRIKAQLLTVSWTVVSGSSGDWTLLSGLTPQNLQCRVRLYDPGSGVTARIQFKNADGTKSSTDLFLEPNLRYPPDMRVIANPYQFFAFYPGNQGIVTKGFICGGVPALYDFDVGFITQAVWCHGDATSTGDTTFRRSFRWLPDVDGNAAAWQLCNSSDWQSGSGGKGHQKLVAFVPGANPANASTYHNPILYYSGEAYKTPVGICWGSTGPADFPYEIGQLWDAAIVLDAFPADVETTFDGHDWYNIMQVYTAAHPVAVIPATSQGLTCRCSLWVVIG